MFKKMQKEKAAHAAKLVRKIGVAVAVCALAGCLVACAQPRVSDADLSSDETQAGLEGLSNFTDNDTGNFPNTTWNEKYVNAGNRGCNSCHESLQSVIDNSGLAYDHPISKVGYSNSRNVTVLDGCLSCHAIHTADYGNYFADAIHTVHYSSAGFTNDLGGNCWTCHAINDTADLTQLGTTDMVLWEQVAYTGKTGGFPDTSDSLATRVFLQERGHETGFVTDVQAEAEPNISVDMSQGISDEADAFVALNHSGKFDEQDRYDFSHTITLTGVKEPHEFTYDELKAMKQSTIRATNQCVVAGSAGHNIYNAEYTGVMLQDLVDACGGLADGVNQAYVTGWDEWECCSLNSPIDEYLPKSMVALQMNGHNVSYEYGGPMLLVTPGMGGAFWCKFVKTVDFNQGDEPFDFVEAMADSIPGDTLNKVSAAWFQNDGLTFKKGEPVELTGYAYALGTSVAPLQAIEFSCDLGVTWTRVEVPEGFDPMQWVTFNFSWTPETAGTHIINVRGVNSLGEVNVVNGGIIVKVEE